MPSLENIPFYLTVIHSLNTTDAQNLQLILPKQICYKILKILFLISKHSLHGIHSLKERQRNITETIRGAPGGPMQQETVLHQIQSRKQSSKNCMEKRGCCIPCFIKAKTQFLLCMMHENPELILPVISFLLLNGCSKAVRKT